MEPFESFSQHFGKKTMRVLTLIMGGLALIVWTIVAIEIYTYFG